MEEYQDWVCSLCAFMCAFKALPIPLGMGLNLSDDVLLVLVHALLEAVAEHGDADGECSEQYEVTSFHSVGSML